MTGNDASGPGGTATATATIACSGLRVGTTGGREVLHGVDYAVAPGEILALVGESGSGKTTAALAALGHFRTGLVHTGGTIRFDGHTESHDDLLTVPPATIRGIRGRLVSYVPQDPALSLNPLLRIGTQVSEVLEAHGYDGDVGARVQEVLTDVGLDCDDAFLGRYPHQLSGGQQQRVAIARAIAKRPEVLLCDEPTGALDVHTGITVLEAIERVNRELGTLAVIITHNAAIAAMADRVLSLSAGRILSIEANEGRAPVRTLSW